MNKKKISVVIPFFQRKAGLLAQAVESALKQDVNALVRLVIVDDGSPIPAEVELREALRTHKDQIILVKQRNAGCYPASNTALEHVPADTDFVAFLDSDDVWAKDHLSHALWALTNGYEFYFSDFYQLNQTVSAFTRGKRINLSNHRRIHDSEPLYSFDADMVNQIITGNVLGTSTIVYSYKKFRDIRYRTEFVHTGGEYILWLQLALGTKKIAFGALPECTYGGGVNIYSDLGWGTDKYLSIASDEIRYRKWIAANLELSAQQMNALNRKLREKRIHFSQGLIHNALHLNINIKLLKKHLKIDPTTFFVLPVVPGIIVLDRFRRSAAAPSHP
jgi:succinoglycan biosynthesis protein ExoW